eukprot:5236328-Amphidinium_carterae.1
MTVVFSPSLVRACKERVLEGSTVCTDGAPAYNFLEKHDRLAANISSCVLSACHHTSRLLLVVEAQALHRHPRTGPEGQFSKFQNGRMVSTNGVE